MNLINDPWIKVVRRSGQRSIIAPWQITSDYESDPVLAIAWPRADFNAAIAQFLIGIFQTVAAPANSAGSHIAWSNDNLTCPEWDKWLVSAPDPEELHWRMQSISVAFEFGNDQGPNFLNDYSLSSDGESKPISSLLIEAPGENTIKRNTDHFIKRDFVNNLCLPCTATALYTLQSNAPSGGQGHRTSPRGGGPLTTLLVMDSIGGQIDETLWVNTWLNVLPLENIEQLPGGKLGTNLSLIFSWLAEPKTSENDRTLNAGEAHALQIYWPAPRRISINFKDLAQGICSICLQTGALVQSYRTKNYGTKYGPGWHHPLTPYVQNKEGSLYPILASPDATCYRRWSDLVGKCSATVVKHFYEIKPSQVQLRLWISGFDMDNMKAVGWIETTVPLYQLPPALRDSFDILVQRLVNAASEVSTAIRKAVKDAWLSEHAGSSGDLSQVSQNFLELTENAFYSHILQLKEALENDESYQSILQSWLDTMVLAANRIFDRFATTGGMQYANQKRLSSAHSSLMKMLYSKKLKESLSLPLTQEKKQDASLV